MANSDNIELLKYCGIVVTSALALLNLVTKTTYEDENNVKRLTVTGHIAIALITGAWIISVLALSYQSIFDRQSKIESASAAREAERARAQELFLTQFKIDRQFLFAQQQALLRRAEAADIRADAATQKAITLSTAAAQRDREISISRDINSSSIANLSKASAVLENIDRLSSPVDGVQIRVVFVFKCGTDIPLQVCKYDGIGIDPRKLIAKDPDLNIRVDSEKFDSNGRVRAIAMSVSGRKDDLSCYMGPPPVGRAGEDQYEYCRMSEPAKIFASGDVVSVKDFKGMFLYISDTSYVEFNWAKFIFSIQFTTKNGQLVGVARPDLKILKETPDLENSPYFAKYQFSNDKDLTGTYVPNMGTGRDP